MADKNNTQMPSKDVDMLRDEVLGLFQYIQRFKEEVAQMVERDHEHDQTRFENVSDQLDAIVQATEDATNLILERMEMINDVVSEIRDTKEIEAVAPLCDKLEGISMGTIEACTFQDITGQRVTKIIRSMQFVEERIDHMLGIWGRDEIEKLAAEKRANREKLEGDAALLSGPALASDVSISQDEIDALFD